MEDHLYDTITHESCAGAPNPLAPTFFKQDHVLPIIIYATSFNPSASSYNLEFVTNTNQWTGPPLGVGREE